MSSHKVGRHAFAARLLGQGKSLKLVQEADFPGVQLSHHAQFSLLPLGTVVGPGSTQLRLENGTTVQIDLGPTGRAHLCSVGGAVAGWPVC